MNSTCRKVTQKHNEYVGFWVTGNYQRGSCYQTLEIKSNSKGSLDGKGDNDCATNISAGGTTRISKKNIFIGPHKFKLLEEANYNLTIDSVGYFTKYKVLMEMTLQSSNYHHAQVYKFYKLR